MQAPLPDGPPPPLPDDHPPLPEEQAAAAAASTSQAGQNGKDGDALDKPSAEEELLLKVKCGFQCCKGATELLHPLISTHAK